MALIELKKECRFQLLSRDLFQIMLHCKIIKAVKTKNIKIVILL